jgi:diaminopimelate epimerase
MDLRFVKTNPTGNTTILVESPVKIEDQAEIAGILMRDDFISAEQVGFIGSPQNPLAAAASLRMMGGEFCGNAAMSLGAFLVWRDGGTEGEINVPLEVSGSDGVTECIIKRNGDDFQDFQGTVKMPPPERVEEISLPLAGMERKFAAIRLPGIAHVIVPLEIFASAEEAKISAEQAAAKWGKLIEGEAFGILLHEREKNSIIPLVCVKASGTAVWERGCGSGSAAIGAYLAGLSGTDESAQVSQPGGVIAVDARCENGAVMGISITGNVKIVARGTAYI